VLRPAQKLTVGQSTSLSRPHTSVGLPQLLALKKAVVYGSVAGMFDNIHDINAMSKTKLLAFGPFWGGQHLEVNVHDPVLEEWEEELP